MVFSGAGAPLREVDLAERRPGRGRCCSRFAPAASAAPTCTSSTASSPTRSCRSCSATRSSARVVELGAGVDALRARRPRRRALAGLDLRRLPLLPVGPREPLRPRALHRLHARRRLRRVRGGRRALLLPAPGGYTDLQAAPLLCAGLIGYRALRLAGDAERLGLYGFGAAAHIIAQVARWQGRRVFAFTRAGRRGERRRSRASSAPSGPAGRTSRRPSRSTRRSSSRPAGALVPAALAAVPRAARSSAPAST